MNVLICICSAGTNSTANEGKKKKSLGIVKCNTCDNTAKWSKMKSWREEDAADTEGPMEVDAFDPEAPKWHWAYMCATCVKADLKLDTEQLAYDHILASSGTAGAKKAKVARFKDARAKLETSFAALGVEVTGHKLYQLTRASLLPVFESILDLVELKAKSIEILASTLEENKVLREELARTKDLVRTKEIVELIANENEKHHKMLAFKDKAGNTDWGKWQASTFHDEYVKTKNGSMRYWFVCMAGGSEWPCMTAILSKKWKRKFEDPAASKNKYKCTVCEANFKTKWGVFVELQLGDKLYVLRAEVPDEDTLDIKAMDLERKHKEIGSAQALFDAIPMVAPTETKFIECLDEEKGQYRLSGTMAEYMTLPVWKWATLFELSKGPVEEVAK
jgi:hypothetical protein